MGLCRSACRQVRQWKMQAYGDLTVPEESSMKRKTTLVTATLAATIAATLASVGAHAVGPGKNPLAQDEPDRQALGIDHGVDLGGQAAARATHATGSAIFFWALAAC